MPEREPAGDTARTDTDASPTEKSRCAELTAFQRDLLYVLRHEGASYGLAIKRAIEEYYAESVNHGQLYPNLDALVEERLVEKGSRDQRTNEYRLTDAGEQALNERQVWIEAEVGE